MKYMVINVFCMAHLFVNSCNNNTTAQNTSIDSNSKSNKMTFKIGSKTFEATLYDNATATAFKAMLPLTLDMIELNSNEKYADLAKNLPTNAANPRTIQNGDLMLWGANTLVLFYKTFSTPYSYTKLGRVTDTAGLAAALGNKHVTVTFELP